MSFGGECLPLRLHQIPQVAIEVFEHSDRTEGFFPRFSHEHDAFGLVKTEVAPEVIGVQEQKYAAEQTQPFIVLPSFTLSNKVKRLYFVASSVARVSCAIKLVSQVFPPSSEKACSNLCESWPMSDQIARTRMVLLLKVS